MKMEMLSNMHLHNLVGPTMRLRVDYVKTETQGTATNDPMLRITFAMGRQSNRIVPLFQQKAKQLISTLISCPMMLAKERIRRGTRLRQKEVRGEEKKKKKQYNHIYIEHDEASIA